MSKYRRKFTKTAVSRYSCASDDRIALQFYREVDDEMSGFYKFRIKNLIINLFSGFNDRFVFRQFGDFSKISENKEEVYDLLSDCSEKIHLSVAEYNDKDMDYTKCNSVNICGLESEPRRVMLMKESLAQQGMILNCEAHKNMMRN